MIDKPEIVCLCGSTRFMAAFFAAGWELTLAGQIVLSVGICKHGGDVGHGAEAIGQDVADRLDELHKRKIDLADWVLVLNVGGYAGKSTRAEIEYARDHAKPVTFLNGIFNPAPPKAEAYPTWDKLAVLTRAAIQRHKLKII